MVVLNVDLQKVYFDPSNNTHKKSVKILRIRFLQNIQVQLLQAGYKVTRAFFKTI